MSWASPNMTSNTAPSPYVASASRQISATYAAWKALDGNPATYWEPSNNSSLVGDWVALYVGTVKVCVNTLTIKNYGSGYGVHTFRLQGSNDYFAWTDIYSGHCDDNNSVQTYSSLGNTLYYHHYRIIIDSGYYATDLAILEITMAGEYETANYLHARRDRMNMRGVSTQNNLA